jgi:V/A-type H+-transporting ATPase subunit C
MKESDYIYAVARIRVSELGLLSGAFVEQLIAAPLEGASALLRDKGYAGAEKNAAALNDAMAKTWDLLTEILPKPGQLDFLVIRNDFHNLKAQLKCLFTGDAPGRFFLRPAVFSPEEIWKLLQAKQFQKLPPCMAACAEGVYDRLAKTLDGQLADAVVDRQCLETMVAMAQALGSNFAAKLAQLLCTLANIQIAARALKTGKGQDFLEQALCDSAIPKKALLAVSNKAQLSECLRGAGYAEALEALEQSGAAFEKYCDDAVMRYISPAKHESFGIAPLAAYYLAKEAEVKTLRIVLSCKQNGVPVDEIRRKARLLYV